MEIRELAIPDSYEITPRKFEDARGLFMESFRRDQLFEATGLQFEVKQTNTSVSKRGTVRGIHFADVPPGQAKYVTVVSGAVVDFVVDIRVGSPKFGKWEAVRLDDSIRNAVFLTEGLGHCFVALTDLAVVNYLVSETYDPAAEHGVDPLDNDLALEFPFEHSQLLMSPKDLEAPSLSTAKSTGLLPEWAGVRKLLGSRVKESEAIS